MKDRLDYVLSNWIFIWFIIYYIKIINIPSPKFALIIALLLNIPVIIITIYKNRHNDLKKVYPFILFIIFTKLIPLILLKNEKINIIDIISFGILFGLNIMYVIFHTQNIYKAYYILRNRINNGILGNIDGSITK
tara:strand:+ start:215 stop:619 length:405 start_codon:yes stop_codon:yes gene_type:complete